MSMPTTSPRPRSAAFARLGGTVSTTNAELIEQLHEVLDDVCDRVGNYAAEAPGSDAATDDAATDDGLVLGVKAHRLLYDAWIYVRSANRRLEKAGAYGIAEDADG
jgi:hypothetical protein